MFNQNVVSMQNKAGCIKSVVLPVTDPSSSQLQALLQGGLTSHHRGANVFLEDESSSGWSKTSGFSLSQRKVSEEVLIWEEPLLQ